MTAPTSSDLARAKQNLDALDSITNSDSSTTVVTPGGQSVKSIAKAIKTLEAFNPRGAWVTATAYALKDIVTQSGTAYVCILAHTSGTFATDLAAQKWAVFQGVTVTDLAQTTAAAGIGVADADDAIPGATKNVETGLVQALKGNSGLGAQGKVVRGIISQIGDSTTDDVAGRPAWQQGIDVEWFGQGGIFEEWVNYNIGNNGGVLGDWASQASGAPTGVAATTRGNPNAAVTANPNIIVISLGINDIRNPSQRATYGSQAALRANLGKLVRWLLEYTHAAIWLRMPNPLANSPESFSEGWSNVTETRTYNGYVRTAYQEWVGRDPRVEVFDTHDVIFNMPGTPGNADTVSTPQDDYGEGNLLDDSLHPSALGFRRIGQAMARQLRSGDGLYPRVMQPKQAAYRAAVWSFQAQVAQVEVSAGNDLVSIFGSPSHLIYAHQGLVFDTVPGKLSNGAVRNAKRIEDFYLNGEMCIDQYLRHLCTVGAFKIYSPTTGTIYTVPSMTATDTVTNPDGQTKTRFTINNSGAALLTGADRDPGILTFYVENIRQRPGYEPQSVSIAMTPGEADDFAGFSCAQTLTLIGVNASRKIDPGYGGSCDLFSTGNNNGVVTGDRFGTVTFGSGLAMMSSFTVDATNYPSGVVTFAPGTYLIRAGAKSHWSVGTIRLQLSK